MSDCAYRQTFDIPAPFHALTDADREVATLLYLDASLGQVGARHFTSDRAESVAASIRLIVTDVLALDAHAVLLAHNHPRGDPRPSRQDMHYTRRLFATLDAIGVRLLDHYVIAPGGWMSFQREGLL
jgi:DNA repair protein RadC